MPKLKFKVGDFVTYYPTRPFCKCDPSKNLGMVVEVRYNKNLKIILYQIRWFYNENNCSGEINYYQQHQITLVK